MSLRLSDSLIYQKDAFLTFIRWIQTVKSSLNNVLIPDNLFSKNPMQLANYISFKKSSKNWYFSMQYLYQFIMALFLKVAKCSFFKDQKRTKKTMTNSDQRFQTVFVSFHLFPSFHLLFGVNWEKYIVNKICNKA